MARSLSARAGSIQMTEGSLYKNILLFSVPLIFSQLLQVLFNMADVAVVGKFSSATALGSVGSTSTLVTLFTGFLIGLSNGVNVRVAQYLGARQEEDTRNCVHTALILCTLSGVVIAVLCFFLAAPMLELLKTKDDLLPGAVLYFRIYALGMPALGIFNFGNAVLSASGDTKRPLAYLTAAGILNVILNLFFVIVCKMAADGVALASIISQYLSAVLVLLHMTHLTDSCRVEWKLLRLHGGEAGRILGLGIPAGIQGAIFSVSNVFIQSGINSFGENAIAGSSLALNFEYFTYDIANAFAQAAVTFTSQNFGAGDIRRCKRIFRLCLLFGIVFTEILSAVFMVWDDFFVSIYTSSSAVAVFAVSRMRHVCSLEGLTATYEVESASLRGMGRSLEPAVFTILGTVVFRLIWMATVFRLFPTYEMLMNVYPASWIFTGAALLIVYVRQMRRTARSM